MGLTTMGVKETVELSSKTNVFGTTYVIEPTLPHTHTAVIVHGRGSDGEDFATELSDSRLSDQKSLAERFPSWRWVFPSSPTTWNATFQEDLPTWFQATSLTNVNDQQDLQAPGISESVRHICSILENEISRLGAMSERLVLGGISQGAAIAIWTILCSGNPPYRIGALFVASAWLPFSEDIDRACKGKTDQAAGTDNGKRVHPLVGSNIQPLLSVLRNTPGSDSVLLTPIMQGHGRDDAYVDISLGIQARDVLADIGFKIQWREYEGAEQEGHWYKTPEQIDDIAEFLSLI